MNVENFVSNLCNGHELVFVFEKNGDEHVTSSSEKRDISIEFIFIDNIRKQLTIKPYCSLFKNNKSDYLNICTSFEDIEACDGEDFNSKMLNFCSEYIAEILKNEKKTSLNEMEVLNYPENDRKNDIDNIVKESKVKFL